MTQHLPNADTTEPPHGADPPRRDAAPAGPATLAPAGPAAAAAARAGIAVLLVTAVLWSLNGPLIKLLARDHVPGLTIACYRSLLGGVLFLPLAAYVLRGPRLPARPADSAPRVPLGWCAAAIAFFTLLTTAFVIATTMTAAANAIVLQYTAPIWVFALSPLLLRERPGAAEGAALLVSMLGIAIIVGYEGLAGDQLPSLLIALSSGFGFGVLTLVLRKLRDLPPAAVTCMNTLGSGLLLLPPMLLLGGATLTAGQFGLVAVLAVFQFTLPYLLYSWALQRVEAHRASLIVLLETVLNPIWTLLFIGERPPTPTLIGGPLILAGVAGWIVMSWRRGAKVRGAVRELQMANSE